MPNCFSASSCCARAGTGAALAAATATAAANVLMLFDMDGASKRRLWRLTVGASLREVIREKRDFYGRRVLVWRTENPMPDRELTFGRFRLDPRGGLTSGAREIKLTPKALALLSYLSERPGEGITKEEVFAAVWPETTVGD